MKNHSIHLTRERAEALRKLIVETPDFPKPGVLFRDLSALVADAKSFDDVIEAFVARWGYQDILPTHIVGIESRGYIYGGALAAALVTGFVSVRKPGKMPPGSFEEVAYKLEYGEGLLQLGHGLIKPGNHVVIVDDLIATGGSAGAAAELVRRAGGIVDGFAFVVEIEALGGRAVLDRNPDAPVDVHALFTF